jgi:TP901 family phage tail tape measure protein
MAEPLNNTAMDMSLRLTIDESHFMRQVSQASQKAQQVFSQRGLSLGRISSDVDMFSKSIEAASARVAAFGATVSIYYAITRGIQGLIRETINFEKRLADVNVILNVSSSQLKRFGSDLFTVAAQTGRSFEEVAEAATEFARQGLGMSETLKRTRDALVLTRLSGLETTESVKALTAAINTFNSEALNSERILNKIAAVDAAYAVSSRDLAAAISRVGTTAQEAGVNFDKLMGIITAVEQRTARGGDVIAHAIRTIFVRIQRADVLDQLEKLGVTVRDVEGNFVSADRVLSQVAQKMSGLSDAQKAYTSELIAGNRQVNILQALLRDLASGNSVVESATRKSADATNEATRRNALLNTTLAAEANKAMQTMKLMAAQVGELAAKPLLERIIGAPGNLTQFTSTLGKISDAIGGEGTGKRIGEGILKGIGSALAGPGLVMGIGILSKLFVQTGTYMKGAMGSLLTSPISNERLNLELSISNILRKQPELYSQIIRGNISVGEATKQVLMNQRLSSLELERQLSLARQMAATINSGRLGYRATVAESGKWSVTSAASGYLPAVTQEMNAVRRGVGGASPTAVPSFATIRTDKGMSPVVVNNSEKIIRNFMGSGQDAVFNPNMIQGVGGGLHRFGQVENIAKGRIPNVAFRPSYDLSTEQIQPFHGHPVKIDSSKSHKHGIVRMMERLTDAEKLQLADWFQDNPTIHAPNIMKVAAGRSPTESELTYLIPKGRGNLTSNRLMVALTVDKGGTPSRLISAMSQKLTDLPAGSLSGGYVPNLAQGNVDNLLKSYYRVKKNAALYNSSADWYKNEGNVLARQLAKKYRHIIPGDNPVMTAAGVIASLSGQTRWPENKLAAEQMFEAVNDGKKLGKFRTATLFKQNEKTAYNILKSGDPASHLHSNKYQNFYDNLLMRESSSFRTNTPAVTADTWHLEAWLGGRGDKKDFEALQRKLFAKNKKKLGGNELYEEVRRDTVEATEILTQRGERHPRTGRPLTPYEIQSIIWMSVKGAENTQLDLLVPTVGLNKNRHRGMKPKKLGGTASGSQLPLLADGFVPNYALNQYVPLFKKHVEDQVGKIRIRTGPPSYLKHAVSEKTGSFFMPAHTTYTAYPPPPGYKGEEQPQSITLGKGIGLGRPFVYMHELGHALNQGDSSGTTLYKEMIANRSAYQFLIKSGADKQTLNKFKKAASAQFNGYRLQALADEVSSVFHRQYGMTLDARGDEFKKLQRFYEPGSFAVVPKIGKAYKDMLIPEKNNLHLDYLKELKRFSPDLYNSSIKGNAKIREILAYKNYSAGHIPNFAVRSIRTVNYGQSFADDAELTTKEMLLSAIGKNKTPIKIGSRGGSMQAWVDRRNHTLRIDTASSASPSAMFGAFSDIKFLNESLGLHVLEGHNIVNPLILQMMASPAMQKKLNSLGVSVLKGNFQKRIMKSALLRGLSNYRSGNIGRATRRANIEEAYESLGVSSGWGGTRFYKTIGEIPDYPSPQSSNRRRRRGRVSDFESGQLQLGLASGHIPNFMNRFGETRLASGAFRDVFATRNPNIVHSVPKTEEEIIKIQERLAEHAFGPGDVHLVRQNALFDRHMRPGVMKKFGEAGLGPKIHKINNKTGEYWAERIHDPTLLELVKTGVMTVPEARNIAKQARNQVKSAFPELASFPLDLGWREGQSLGNVTLNAQGGMKILDFARGHIPNFSTLSKRQLREIMTSTARNQGATYNREAGDLGGTDSFSVSVFPELSTIVNRSDLSTGALRKFVSGGRVARLLRNAKLHSAGTWHDKSSGNVYLDVASTLGNRQDAIKLGGLANQKAIFDLKNFVEIPTGGTGAAVPLPPLQNRVQQMLGMAKGYVPNFNNIGESFGLRSPVNMQAAQFFKSRIQERAPIRSPGSPNDLPLTKDERTMISSLVGQLNSQSKNLNYESAISILDTLGKFRNPVRSGITEKLGTDVLSRILYSAEVPINFDRMQSKKDLKVTYLGALRKAVRDRAERLRDIPGLALSDGHVPNFAKLLKLVHFSQGLTRPDKEGLFTISPKKMGSAFANKFDLMGQPKSFYFVQGSKLGGDRSFFEKSQAYTASVDADKIYDANKDKLGTWGMLNREVRDEVIKKAGFHGGRMKTEDGRDVVWMYKPLKAERYGGSGTFKTALASGYVPNFAESIKSAAIKYKGKIFTGSFHGDAYNKMLTAYFSDPKLDYSTINEADVLDGFLTSKKRFVTREQAAQIAGLRRKTAYAEDFAGKSYASGYIPNFSPLHEAISREFSALKAVGYTAGQAGASIQVGASELLRSAQNPSGLGVYNNLQETSLGQGISFANQRGTNPRMAGLAKGGVPNFVDPQAFLRKYSEWSKLYKLDPEDMSLIRSADTYATANFQLREKEVNRKLVPKYGAFRGGKIFDDINSNKFVSTSGRFISNPLPAQVRNELGYDVPTPTKLGAGGYPPVAMLTSADVVARQRATQYPLEQQPPTLSTKRDISMKLRTMLKDEGYQKELDQINNILNSGGVLNRRQQRLKQLDINRGLLEVLKERGDTITPDARRYINDISKSQLRKLQAPGIVKQRVDESYELLGKRWLGFGSERGLEQLITNSKDPMERAMYESRRKGLQENIRGRRMQAGMQASFAIPMLTQTAMSMANLGENHQQGQRMITGATEGIGMGGMLASMVGFSPAGIGAGAAIAAIMGLKSVVDNLVPSFADLAKKAQEVGATFQGNIDAGQQYIQAQNNMQEMIASGASPSAVRTTAMQSTAAIGGVKDLSYRTRLLTAKNTEEAMRVSLEYQQKSSKTVEGKNFEALMAKNDSGFLSRGSLAALGEYGLAYRSEAENRFGGEEGQKKMEDLVSSFLASGGNRQSAIDKRSKGESEFSRFSRMEFDIFIKRLQYLDQEKEKLKDLTKTQVDYNLSLGNLRKELTGFIQNSFFQNTRTIQGRQASRGMAIANVTGALENYNEFLTPGTRIQQQGKLGEVNARAAFQTDVEKIMEGVGNKLAETVGSKEFLNSANIKDVGGILTNAMSGGGLTDERMFGTLQGILTNSAITKEENKKLGDKLEPLLRETAHELVLANDKLKSQLELNRQNIRLAEQKQTLQNQIGFAGGLGSFLKPEEFIAKLGTIAQGFAGQNTLRKLNEQISYSPYGNANPMTGSKGRGVAFYTSGSVSPTERSLAFAQSELGLKGDAVRSQIKGVTTLRELFPHMTESRAMGLAGTDTNTIKSYYATQLGQTVGGSILGGHDLGYLSPRQAGEVKARVGLGDFGAAAGIVRGASQNQMTREGKLDMSSLAKQLGDMAEVVKELPSTETQVTLLQGIREDWKTMPGILSAAWVNVTKQTDINKLAGMARDAETTVARIGTSNSITERIAAYLGVTQAEKDVLDAKNKKVTLEADIGNKSQAIQAIDTKIREQQGLKQQEQSKIYYGLSNNNLRKTLSLSGLDERSVAAIAGTPGVSNRLGFDTMRKRLPSNINLDTLFNNDETKRIDKSIGIYTSKMTEMQGELVETEDQLKTTTDSIGAYTTALIAQKKALDDLIPKTEQKREPLIEPTIKLAQENPAYVTANEKGFGVNLGLGSKTPSILDKLITAPDLLLGSEQFINPEKRRFAEISAGVERDRRDRDKIFAAGGGSPEDRASYQIRQNQAAKEQEMRTRYTEETTKATKLSNGVNAQITSQNYITINADDKIDAARQAYQAVLDSLTSVDERLAKVEEFSRSNGAVFTPKTLGLGAEGQ